MKKRLVSLAVILTMLCAFVPMAARAYDGTKYGDYLYYEVDDDNTVTITDCDETVDEIAIPSYIDNKPVTTIGYGAFASNSLKKVTFGEGIKYIEGYAFAYCKNLDNVVLPTSLNYIGEAAFGGCENLQNIILPSSLIRIGKLSFAYCSKMKQIIIPEGVKGIEIQAFMNCDRLESITIPSSVEQIGDLAFISCGNLQINVDINNKKYFSIDGVLFNKDRTEIIAYAKDKLKPEYTIPSSVTQIHTGAFYQCSSLTNIVLQEGVEIIGVSAFDSCTKLTCVSIPYSVYIINGCAFHECGELTDVYYSGDETDWKDISINTNSNDDLTKRAIIHYNGRYEDDEIDFNEFITGLLKDLNHVTINYNGTAYGYFRVIDIDGNILENETVTYSVDGDQEKSGITDVYGILCVPISNISKSHDYTILISGSGVKPSTGTLSVTVTPLEFSSSYEATVTKGASAALGIGVGGSIGKLEAEAQAAEIGANGSNKKGFSYSQERKNGKTKLSLTAKENMDAAIKAKVGLWAGASAGKAGVEVSAGDIHGSAKYGNTMSVGFEDDDFNWSDSSDVTRLSMFMTQALLESMDSNVAIRWLVDKLAANADIYEKGSTATLGAGASIGSVKVKKGDKDIGGVTLGGIDASAVWSQSTKTAKDNSTSRKSSVAASAGYKLFDVSLKKKDGDQSASTGAAAWSRNFINNKVEFSSASDKNGNITSLGLSYINDTNNDIFWSKKSQSDKRTITYSDNAAKNVAASYGELNDFANGNKGWFSLGQMRKASDVMTNSNEQGAFSASTTKTKGVDLNASASIQLFLKLGGELGISGTESYTYNTENGIYKNNTVFTQAKNNISDAVENEFVGVEDAFGVAAGYIGNIISGYWDTISGWIDNAASAVVDFGKAAIKKTKDTLTGWKVSITTAIDKISPFSVMAVDSEFSLFSTSSVATTLGNPYIVEVTDDNDNIITDLSENPLMLTLEYDDEMLAEAGVENVEDIAIYRWDKDKCVYIRMGGTLDAANKTLSLEITKPGQYILAADNCPPAVTEFKASDGGKSPEISAVVSDMSGIKDFAFTIDGQTLVNNDNLNDYYNHTTAHFTYQTIGLSAGEHTAVITASDSAGNTLAGETLVFTVNTDAPVISDVTELDSEISDNITVSANVNSANLSAVFLNVEDNGVRSSYEMTEDNGVYTAAAGDITSSGLLKVWVSAYDTNGNEGVSDKQTVLFTGDDAALVITDASEGSVTVKALNCDGLSGKVILALYDEDGKLIDIARKDLQSELVFENVAAFTSVKAMLWDGLTSMTPLAKAGSIEINNLN